MAEEEASSRGHLPEMLRLAVERRSRPEEGRLLWQFH
jgi:hypothetical protein